VLIIKRKKTLLLPSSGVILTTINDSLNAITLIAGASLVAGDYLPSSRRRHWISRIVCLDQAASSTCQNEHEADWTLSVLRFPPCNFILWGNWSAVHLHHVNLQGLMTVHSRAVLQQQTRWV